VFASDAQNIPYGLNQLSDGEIVPMPGQPGRATVKPASPVSNELNIVQWLGIKCKEANFQRFLGCSSDGQTVDKVRDICQVGSRADIPFSEEAKRLFMEHIYQPYVKSSSVVPLKPWGFKR
jgi:hypothetical protein